jgi:hypothetical protein
MFIKKTYSKNHTYLSLTETYREDGKVKHRAIAQLGRLDILLANEQLKRLVESLERLYEQKKKYSFEDLEVIGRANWGAEKVYRSLWDKFEFSNIFKEAFNGKRNAFCVSETLFIDVISRLLKPCSKLKLSEALNKLKNRFNIREVIIVADRGINSKMNLKLILESGFNYIVGSRLKSMSNKIKRDVLDKDKYKILFSGEDRTTLSYSFPYESHNVPAMQGAWRSGAASKAANFVSVNRLKPGN